MEPDPTYDGYIIPQDTTKPADLPPWVITLAREIVRQANQPGHYTIQLHRTNPHKPPHITIAKIERLRDWTPQT